MRIEDVPAVRRLERRSFGRYLGTAAALRGFLARPWCGGVLAVAPGGRLAGYLLYRLDPQMSEVRLYQVAVQPARRRQRIGSLLLWSVVRHAPSASGIRVRTGVNESNLPAQLFLRANCFRAIHIAHGAACGGTEDLYVFEYQPTV